MMIVIVIVIVIVMIMNSYRPPPTPPGGLGPAPGEGLCEDAGLLQGAPAAKRVLSPTGA